ncbi:MAG TPA: SPFH domain-containing protein, partial [Burkholderiales bacterium]|nr:SPFH domain-containing protein [Burkholderiales bacterium]
DSLVNKINNKIAKILGKKCNSKNSFNGQNNKVKIKNWIFSLTIIFLLIFLWAITGFYYLSDNQYGVVIRNGKIDRVVKGIKFGFNAPYPIDQLYLINAAVSENIHIGKASFDDADYVILSKDLKPFEFTANFTYQIIEPKALFLSILQNENKIIEIVKCKMRIAIRQYIASKIESELLDANLIVTANEIRYKLNQDLLNYGIKINKLDIESLNKFKTNTLTKNANKPIDVPIVNKLLWAANEYHQNQIALTKVNIDKFNKLLLQYQQNPQNIIEQMYYDMLLSIPSNMQDNYALLNLSLSELFSLSNQDEQKEEIRKNLNLRDSSRVVKRYRDI